MWEDYSINGLANQITAVPNANISYINTLPPLTTLKPIDSIIISRNYKLLKRNRYLRLK